MKKFTLLFILFCFGTVIISGCSKQNTQLVPQCRVVTRVDISCVHEKGLIQRNYTDSEKMESVLLYLRLLKPFGKPETDPELIDAAVFEITVHLSDGDRHIYRQKDHRYFSENSHPWKKIDPTKASGLYALMRHYASDPVL